MNKPLYIVWKDDFNINCPVIDEQHRAIAATINSLYFFIQEGWDVEDLAPTVNLITMYAKFHARTEEGLLMEADCQFIDDHFEAHRVFDMDLKRANKEAIDYNDPAILLNFLKVWWQTHLNAEHQKYAQFFDVSEAVSF